MKKEYISPDVLIVSLSIVDVLTASYDPTPYSYDPTPQIPTRGGNDNPDDDLFN